MTREEIYNSCAEYLHSYKCLILELVTGYGKSKLAIDLTNKLLDEKENQSILLLVPKTVLKQNWLDEINKWGGFHNNPNLTIECYESLKNHANKTYDIVICDEAHHLASDNRRELFDKITITNHLFVLSATLTEEMKDWFRYRFPTKVITCNLQEAIDSNVLPKPHIYLYPLDINADKSMTELIEVCPKKYPVFEDEYKNMWRYIREKKHCMIHCNKSQKLQYYNSQVLYYKNLFLRTKNAGMKNKWLKLCNERLKYLAMCKTDIVSKFVNKLSDKRAIIFCASIAQAEKLRDKSVAIKSACIHSKNNDAKTLVDAFNSNLIDHIYTVQMLNEGANLKDCEYAVFANLNASPIISNQRLGRSLRHPNPIIIIPYYRATREEEIVKDMLKDYDESLIETKEWQK